MVAFIVLFRIFATLLVGFFAALHIPLLSHHFHLQHHCRRNDHKIGQP